MWLVPLRVNVVKLFQELLTEMTFLIRSFPLTRTLRVQLHTRFPSLTIVQVRKSHFYREFVQMYKLRSRVERWKWRHVPAVWTNSANKLRDHLRFSYSMSIVPPFICSSFSLSLPSVWERTTQNGPLFHSTSLSDFLLFFFLSLFVRKLHTGLLFCQFISTHGLSTPSLFLSLFSLTFSLVHKSQHPPLHSLFLDGFLFHSVGRSLHRSFSLSLCLSLSRSSSLSFLRALRFHATSLSAWRRVRGPRRARETRAHGHVYTRFRWRFFVAYDAFLSVHAAILITPAAGRTTTCTL